MTFSDLNTRQKNYLLFGGIYGIASILLFVMVRLCDIPSSVYDGYFPYADAMASGIAPYTEQVYVYGYWNVWEYPPLAYLFIFIPRLIGWTPAAYQAAFIAMTFVIFLIGLYFTERIANDLGDKPFAAMLLYTVLMMGMFEFQADRFDIIPAVLIVIVFSMMIRKKYEWAFIFLAIGTLIKLYPVFLAPILLIYLLSIKEYKRAGVSVVASVLTALMILGLFAISGINPFEFLTYHTDRPLEIESLAATIISFVNLFVNLNITTVFSYGSDNIVGSISDSIASVMLWITGGLMVVCYFAYAYITFKKKRTDLQEISISILMVLLVFMLFSTVFSGQYIIWAMPAVILCMMLIKDKSDSALVLIIFAVAEILTQLNFAVNFGMRGEGMDMNAVGIIVVLLRNIVLVYLLGALTYMLIGKNPPVPKRLSRFIESKVSK